MEEIDLYLEEAKELMEKALHHVHVSFGKIRAGKAMPSMLDGLMVEYYGNPTPINQVASINTPDAKSIIIKPWEKTIIPDIEKSIINSDLGLNPQNDGEIIRLNIPPLSEERRQQLVKQTHHEAEVGKIKNNTELEISLGAIPDRKFPALLNFIAPKGTEENGAVQFTIKADVTLDKDYYLRAGYSANAEIILEEKDSVLSVREALLRFDKETEKPYVEVKTGEDSFERRDLELGISDGINVEVISGVTLEDEIKIWNKTEKADEEEEESEE